MEAGTVERWIDQGYQKVYEPIFSGDWRSYDPFDTTHRLHTHEIPSPEKNLVERATGIEPV